MTRIRLWYQDSNLGTAGGAPPDLLSKFDRLEDWAEAIRHMRVYMWRVSVLEKQSNQFVAEVLAPFLTSNGIALALNATGATFTRLNDRQMVRRERDIDFLVRLNMLGIDVRYISLQSVLSKGVKDRDPDDGIDAPDYPMDQRIVDIIEYMRIARAIYPNIRVGLIDATLAHGKDYEITFQVLTDLLAREGLHLDHVHLDISYPAMRDGRHGASFVAVEQFQAFVESESTAFGLACQSRNAGTHSSERYYEHVLAAMEGYLLTGAKPREFIFTSFFPYPELTVPEYTTDPNDYTMTRIFRKMGDRLREIERS